jgi:hypothetical protein
MISVSHVFMIRPGAPAVTFDFDNTDIAEVTDSENEAALYLPGSDSAGWTGYIVRTDGSFRRSFPIEGRPAASFDRDGEVLFIFDNDGVIRAHSAREERDAELGAWSVPASSRPATFGPDLTLHPGPSQLTVCANLGLRTLSLAPDSPHILDGDPCVPHSLLVRRDRFVYSVTSGQKQVLRSVPQGGSAAPVALAHADVPPLAIDAERVAWTTRPPVAPESYDNLSNHAGDGWVDDKRFMERGRLATFSADGRHLYFLEHAATGDGIGELRSYEIATGISHLLALNTRQFAELPDGRLIAATNASAKNLWNRVVVIDEARRTIDWVADGSDAFTLLSGSQDVLVELVTDAKVVTLVRMPIPQVSP